MSTVTTEQKNEVIGRFMGYNMYDKRYPRNHGVGAPEAVPERCMIIQKAKYHSSWDALMPVVEKIEMAEMLVPQFTILRSAANVQIYYKACIITYEPDEESGDNNEGAAIHAQGETKLEATHEAVYQFITWYNEYQQKQTNDTTGTNKG